MLNGIIALRKDFKSAETLQLLYKIMKLRKHKSVGEKNRDLSNLQLNLLSEQQDSRRLYLFFSGIEFIFFRVLDPWCKRYRERSHVFAIADQHLQNVKASLPHAVPSAQDEVHEQLRGMGTARTPDPDWPKWYPETACSATKTRRKNELWYLSFQVKIPHDKILISWKWLNICLLMRSTQWTLVCIAHVHRFCFA